MFSRGHMKRNPGTDKQATGYKMRVESGGNKPLSTYMQQGKVPQVAGRSKGKESGSDNKPQAAPIPRISGTQGGKGLQ